MPKCMQQSLLAVLLLTAPGLGACSMMPWHSDAEPVSGATKKTEDGAEAALEKAPKLMEEQELKLAKLWARVDELEEEEYRQKERLRIVEKGLTLGLVPEELKHPEKPKTSKSSRRPRGETDQPEKSALKRETPKELPETESEGVLSSDDEAKSEKKASQGEPASQLAPNGLSKEDNEAYQKALANAHDLYRSGRYGRAIVEYSEIGKRFGDKVDGGMHLYWIAKSWVNLKEYNSAKQHLQDFLKDHGDSPWAARAKLELGRVQWQLGMQDTALATFRSIIQEHPYADAAEMAKMELENLDKKL